MLSTGAEKPGDVMFVLGCFAEERVVPVGVSFAHRGMPYIRHDAVGAQLMIPIGRTRPRGARSAASGAEQSAVAHAEAASGCGSSETTTSSDEEVEALRGRLETMEEDDDVPEDFQRLLASFLYQKRTVTTGGVKRQYVAGPEESNRQLKRLLKRRPEFMAANRPPASWK